MLNRLWIGFFLLAFVCSLYQYAVVGNALIFEQMMTALFAMAKLTVEIAIGLIGLLAFWLGMMAIAERAGLIAFIARGLAPLFERLMPDVPKGHPAIGSMMMNLAANFLGLDNAATPLGLKAMHDLQALNPNKDTATNAQILFLVLNTSSITLFPVTIFMYRAQQGAATPTDVFIPILLATFASTMAGLLAVAWVQKIALWQRWILLYVGGLLTLVLGLVGYFLTLTAEALAAQSSLMANFLLLFTLCLFVAVAAYRKVDVYEQFISGAKQGFEISIQLIPYLLAMLCALGLFRASGALDLLMEAVRVLVNFAGVDARFVDALPTALMKPFSGSGARAMMIETMASFGADSFVGRLVSIVQGSTETTFYVLAVYFGAVGIKYTRHAVACALVADVAGITAAIAVCYWFFG
ncbi:MAG: nucleoside recognition domain-containing protein [Marinagarivorans sp.]|nr:nucleoside recognition domain-containing protein [Marinagarivorans sp.]